MKTQPLSLVLVVVAAITIASAPEAQAANVLVNGSFENYTGSITTSSGTTFGDPTAFDNLTGWTHGVGNTAGALANGDAGPSQPPYRAGNGSTIPFHLPTNGDTFALFDSGTFVLSQAISVAGAGAIDVSYDLIWMAATSNSGDITFRLELFDGADASAASLYDVTTVVRAGPFNETWVTINSATLSNTGTDLFVRITALDNVGGQLGAVDNIVVDYEENVIPAPAALPAGLGLLGLAAMRRRHIR